MLSLNHDPSFLRPLEEARSHGINIGIERTAKALIKRIDSGMFDNVEEVKTYVYGVLAATLMGENKNPQDWDKS